MYSSPLPRRAIHWFNHKGRVELKSEATRRLSERGSNSENVHDGWMNYSNLRRPLGARNDSYILAGTASQSKHPARTSGSTYELLHSEKAQSEWRTCESWGSSAILRTWWPRRLPQKPSNLVTRSSKHEAEDIGLSSSLGPIPTGETITTISRTARGSDFRRGGARRGPNPVTKSEVQRQDQVALQRKAS